jgi:hypothetical protein
MNKIKIKKKKKRKTMKKIYKMSSPVSAAAAAINR